MTAALAAPAGPLGAPLLRLDVSPEIAGLSLWFTETHHAGAQIPAVTLAAHLGGDVPPGSLLAPRPGTPAGTLRWQLRSGLVEGLTVVPGLRADRIGRLLPIAARALAVLRGWPPLHGDLRAAGPVARTGVERLVGDLPARLI